MTFVIKFSVKFCWLPSPSGTCKNATGHLHHPKQLCFSSKQTPHSHKTYPHAYQTDSPHPTPVRSQTPSQAHHSQPVTLITLNFSYPPTQIQTPPLTVPSYPKTDPTCHHQAQPYHPHLMNQHPTESHPSSCRSGPRSSPPKKTPSSLLSTPLLAHITKTTSRSWQSLTPWIHTLKAFATAWANHLVVTDPPQGRALWCYETWSPPLSTTWPVCWSTAYSVLTSPTVTWSPPSTFQ